MCFPSSRRRRTRWGISARTAKVWKTRGETYSEWQAQLKAKRDEVKDLMPPLKEERGDDAEET